MSELKFLRGKAGIKGRLALVPQQAWIFSGKFDSINFVKNHATSSERGCKFKPFRFAD
jgi:hypothetical protein